MDADWYPDPSNATQRRYWDGTNWTEHIEVIASEVPPAAAPSLYEPLQAQPQYQPVVSQGYGPQSAGTSVVAPKNPAVSLLVSFFIPGVGSMINGDVNKGVIILVSSIVVDIVRFLLLFIIIGFFLVPVSIGIWIWGMVDAYQGAVRWNAAHGVIS
jgi:TM2 domain-containing membrane protein YozV